MGADAAAHQGVVGHQLLDPLQAGHDFHQPGVVIGKRGGDNAAATLHSAAALAQLGQLRISPGGADPLAHIQPRQRAHPIHPLRIAQGLVVGEFQVAPALHRLAQEAGVIVFREAIGHDPAVTVDEANRPLNALPAAIGCHQAHEQRREVAKSELLPLQRPIQQFFVELQRRGRGGPGLR